MFDPKIKLSKSLFEKLKEVAAMLGCSVDEFCEQVLQKEADRVLSKSGRKEATAAEVEDIANKLKGLGYLE